ncbi:XOO1806 family protein [Pseudomonas sp. CGJS7]|uniref:XOO1806 family protein n=1 Tax=Pseudomonas sp. CGJS7 TaxID=3109348 RepID=UPI00300B2DD4
MLKHLRQLPLVLTLALGVATGAHAQAKQDTTYLPVWNQNNGKLEYLLQLQPADKAAAARWKVGANTFDAALGLDSGDGLGLVCDRKTGLAGAIGNLANHCMLAALDDDDRDGNRQIGAGVGLSRPGGRVGVSIGSGRVTLPGWLSPNNRTSRVDQNTLAVYAQKNIGREAMVSIGGTLAHAKLIPAGEMPGLADRWSSKSIAVGAGYGNFGANIVGRVVEMPGQQWEALGIGLTWRTPWSGQLTVGAENVVTRGKNPFAPGNGEKDEGTVPYVRYEQDL